MTIETLAWDEPPPPEFRSGAITIGNFDGVHRGHQALLAEVRKQSAVVGGPAVVLTFDPHPLLLLHPERFQPLLTTVSDRAELLRGHGADRVAILRTTPSLLQLSADDFFLRVIREGFRGKAVVEGSNFGFGRNREGSVQTLAKLCGQAGISFVECPSLQLKGQTVSSSRVRGALVRGAVGEAADLLGRPFRLRGTVGVGQKRGQTLGFPTANLEKVTTLIPRDGVYATRVRIPPWPNPLPGAANIGPNPTFGEQVRKVEVHIIGFRGDLYGQELAVEFVERLRDTRAFPGVTELVEQLRRDVEEAQRIVG
jgi:riboflavin kinase/FMN adenylyltransferase